MCVCVFICVVCIHMYVSVLDEDAMTNESYMHVCMCVGMYVNECMYALYAY